MTNLVTLFPCNPVTLQEAKERYKNTPPLSPDDRLVELRVHPHWVDLCRVIGERVIYLTTRPDIL